MGLPKKGEEMANVEFIRHKIDWEGWPDALEWFNDDYGDSELNALIAKAQAHLYGLNQLHDDILDRVETILDEQGDDE